MTRPVYSELVLMQLPEDGLVGHLRDLCHFPNPEGLGRTELFMIFEFIREAEYFKKNKKLNPRGLQCEAFPLCTFNTTIADLCKVHSMCRELKEYIASRPG